MQGLIFLQLQKFAQRQGGAALWERLVREAGVPRKAYAPVRNYPDDELTALVGAANRALNLPVPAILEAFGEFLAPELLRLYERLIDPRWKTLDLLENTDKIMHSAVRVGNPGAKPPVLECIRTTENDLHIIYTSGREMCSLAKGIIRGLARHYDETITVTEEACMLRGDPYCALEVVRAPVSSTTEICETTPVSGLSSPALSDLRVSLSFLKPPLQPDEIGRLAEFRILQLIGQGGMGIVFRAEDTRLGRIVALKVMHPQWASNAVMRARFLREARAMAAVKSDHVVTVYEVAVVGEMPFLAMEFLEGESLDTLQKRVGRLPLRTVLRIGREMAQGLAAAHARGLIHRDIKPANLWLEAPSARIKILDFGLARVAAATADLSQLGLIVGTPTFMAPEQAVGKAPDFRADLFSLGCVLYLLATGEAAFQGSDILSALTNLATHDPAAPHALLADVPADLSDLIMHLLQKDPARRPASSHAVAERLAEIEADHFPHAAAHPTHA
jgi:predicted Ser/Thr protein kinase